MAYHYDVINTPHGPRNWKVVLMAGKAIKPYIGDNSILNFFTRETDAQKEAVKRTKHMNR